MINLMTFAGNYPTFSQNVWKITFLKIMYVDQHRWTNWARRQKWPQWAKIGQHVGLIIRLTVHNMVLIRPYSSSVSTLSWNGSLIPATLLLQ